MVEACLKGKPGLERRLGLDELAFLERSLAPIAEWLVLVWDTYKCNQCHNHLENNASNPIVERKRWKRPRALMIWGLSLSENAENQFMYERVKRPWCGERWRVKIWDGCLSGNLQATKVATTTTGQPFIWDISHGHLGETTTAPHLPTHSTRYS